MSWVKLDDQFHSHPKVIAGGNEAAGVYARSLAYCGAYYTDGFVSRKQAALFAVTRVLSRVTQAGFWEEVAPGEARTVTDRRDSGNRPLADVTVTFDYYGFFIDDFLHHNPTKAEADAAREKRRSAGSKGGANAQAGAKADAKQTLKHLFEQNSSTPPTRPVLKELSSSKSLPVDNFQAEFLEYAAEIELHPSQRDRGLALGPTLLRKAVEITKACLVYTKGPAAYFDEVSRRFEVAERVWRSSKPLEERLEGFVGAVCRDYDDQTLQEELVLKGADQPMIDRLIGLADERRAA